MQNNLQMKENPLKIIKTSNIEGLPDTDTDKSKSSIFGKLKSTTSNLFGKVFGDKSK